jgi:hypothetical protein
MLVVCVHQKIRFIRKSSNKYLEAGKNWKDRNSKAIYLKKNDFTFNSQQLMC